jgi:hypothetical protein
MKRPPPPRKYAFVANPFLTGGFQFDASTPVHTPWKILIPHSTMTMASTSVAAVSTLSKEATLILTLRFPAPLTGLGDSLIPLQSHDHNALNVSRRLCFTGHTSGCGGAFLRHGSIAHAPIEAEMPASRDDFFD